MEEQLRDFYCLPALLCHYLSGKGNFTIMNDSILILSSVLVSLRY